MGRQAAVVQSVPNDPSYLLDPENLPEPTYLHDKYTTIFGAIMGFGFMTFRNYNARRPLLAGAPYITLATAAGAGVGYLVYLKNKYYWADRDAILRHYVQLHPEDFPARERIVIGDMLKKWVPAR